MTLGLNGEMIGTFYGGDPRLTASPKTKAPRKSLAAPPKTGTKLPKK